MAGRSRERQRRRPRRERRGAGSPCSGSLCPCPLLFADLPLLRFRGDAARAPRRPRRSSVTAGRSSGKWNAGRFRSGADTRLLRAAARPRSRRRVFSPNSSRPLEARGLVAPSPFVVVEANPEDLARNRGLARQWAREGVSGVSLGAQSLDDRRLRFLGRAPQPARRCEPPSPGWPRPPSPGSRWTSSTGPRDRRWRRSAPNSSRRRRCRA